MLAFLNPCYLLPAPLHGVVFTKNEPVRSPSAIVATRAENSRYDGDWMALN